MTKKNMKNIYLKNIEKIIKNEDELQYMSKVKIVIYYLKWRKNKISREIF